MKNEAENIDKPQGNGVLPCVSISFFDYGMTFTSKEQAKLEIKDHGHYNPKTGRLRRKQPTCVRQAIEFLKNEC